MSFAAALAVVLASAGARAAEPPPPPFGPQTGAPAVKAPQVSTRQPTPELIYKPIAPCRAFAAQAIGAGQTKNFRIAGACGVPAYAAAVALNLSANASPAAGGLTAFASGTARPPITSLSIPVSGGFGTAGSTVSLGASGAISVYASKPATVYGDVTGYYAQQIGGMIAPDGSIYSGGTGIVSSSLIGPGMYSVTVDRDVTYCTPVATAYSGRGVYASAYAFDGNKVTVYTWYLSSSTHLEVGNSYYVYLAVHC